MENGGRALSETEAEAETLSLPQDEAHEEDDIEETAIAVSQLGVVLLFVALLVGQLLKMCTQRFHVPYTPVLTIVAVILGMCDKWMQGGRDTPSDSVIGETAIVQVNYGFHNPSPELVFLIFLPALIFESAFNSDWHTFKRQFIKILLMAGPMLMFSTFSTAAVMYYVLQFSSEFNNISWIGCVLFGAIISATDPVAVVSLLKELGVSKRISTMIEGESLLNDGTALVMFLILITFVEGESPTVGEMIGQFCKMSLLGPLLGLIFGMIMAFMLSRIHN